MSNAIYYPPYYENECWWKFANVISMLDEHSILLEEDFVGFDKVSLLTAIDAFDNLLTNEYPELLTTTTIDDEQVSCAKQPILDIFMLLQKRYYNHFVFKTRHEDSDEAIDEALVWLKKLLNTIEYTYKKYSKIIELYNDNYSTLMRQLETETESGSRFNDTPQEAEVSLSYEDNVYTTNLTKSKSLTKTDSNTPIVKIEEIHRNYRNILLEWLNEFESLFVEEHNV